jgi:hypothetical protein
MRRKTSNRDEGGEGDFLIPSIPFIPVKNLLCEHILGGAKKKASNR